MEYLRFGRIDGQVNRESICMVPSDNVCLFWFFWILLSGAHIILSADFSNENDNAKQCQSGFDWLELLCGESLGGKNAIYLCVCCDMRPVGLCYVYCLNWFITARRGNATQRKCYGTALKLFILSCFFLSFSFSADPFLCCFRCIATSLFCWLDLNGLRFIVSDKTKTTTGQSPQWTLFRSDKWVRFTFGVTYY